MALVAAVATFHGSFRHLPRVVLGDNPNTVKKTRPPGASTGCRSQSFWASRSGETTPLLWMPSYAKRACSAKCCSWCSPPCAPA
eukprot:5087516-Pleurochrysis_carterae.AAC.1